MEPDYVWEAFYAAVLELATSPRALRERLADAYASHLMRLNRGELPADIRGDYSQLESALTRQEPRGAEGRVAASAAGLRELETYSLIESVVRMYGRVAKREPDGENPRPAPIRPDRRGEADGGRIEGVSA